MGVMVPGLRFSTFLQQVEKLNYSRCQHLLGGFSTCCRKVLKRRPGTMEAR
jgi:hypothetical protein